MSFQVRTRVDDADKHSADVNALIYIKGKLYSAADDGKIKVWEEDLSKVTEIQAHATTVFSLAASEDTLYSCSNDGSIKAWDLKDLTSKGTVMQGESEIYKLAYSDGHVFSADDQGVVKVHEGTELKCIYNLLEPLKDMSIVENLLYTVRNLELVVTAMIGDKSNFLTKATLEGRAPMAIVGDKLFFTSRNGRDIIMHENSVDLHFKRVTDVKNAHEMIINALTGTKIGNDMLLYSAGWDKVVKQWKVENGTISMVNSTNADMVVNVLTNGEKGEIYAGGSDGHIVRLDVE